MSILSTNKKLIKVGTEYSAGSGISIDDYVISVTGDVGGKIYSAGENIGIYEQDNQLYISGKDWEQDIANASANAYNEAVAQIPEPQDLSYLSGKIDTNTSGIDYISSVCITAHQDWTDTIKGASSYSYEQSTSYFDNWISGQYTGDITNITNKVTAISGNFDNYYKKTETSSKDEINDALQYVSANAGKVYEGVSPIVVNNTEDKISADTWTFSAGSNVSFVDDNVNKITRIDCTITGEGGDPQVNSFVYDNSAKINDVNSSYQSNSGTFLTAIPSQYATTGDVAELAQTISETYQTKGDYLVRSDSANFYPTNNPSGFITGVDLSNYYTKDETSGKEELAQAFANVPGGGTTYTSPSGTILIDGDTLEGTTSALNQTVKTVNVTPNNDYFSAIPGYPFDKYILNRDVDKGGYAVILYGTWNYGVSVTIDNRFENPFEIPLTSGGFNLSTYNGHYGKISAVKGGVVELALKSELPTYEYDSTNKISAINGSALAGGTTLTGDAQGALDEVYANSGIWLTAHQSLTNYYTKTDTSSKQEISAALTGYQTKLASVNNIVYTASLPATPDANTLYLIPEA